MPMPIKAAIITLNNLKIDAPGSAEIKRRNKAIELAKFALRKLNRRKPTYNKEHPFGACPDCKSEFNSELMNEYDIRCCPWCGQTLAIDGSDMTLVE